MIASPLGAAIACGLFLVFHLVLVPLGIGARIREHEREPWR